MSASRLSGMVDERRRSAAPSPREGEQRAEPHRSFAATHTSTFRYAALVGALVVLSGLVIIGSCYVLVALWERQQEESARQEFKDLLAFYNANGPDALEAEVRRRSVPGSRGRLLDRLTTADHVYALAPTHRARTVAGSLPMWPTIAAEIGPGEIAFSAPTSGSDPSDLRQIRAKVANLPNEMRLLVGRDINVAERLALWLEGAPIWLLLFGLLSGSLGGWVASRRMLGRMEELRRGAEQVMAGEIQHRMPISAANDEFDRLASTLNRMLVEIETLMRAMRRVTDDIAHDLRSPLNRIRQQLDLAQQERHVEAARTLMADAVVEIDRLVSTFNAMLTIATVDSGSLRVDFEEVELDALFRDLEELYRPVSEDRGQRFDASAAGLKVRANRQLLFQALSNLAENAIKYGLQGGRVQVSAHAHRDGVEVLVSDNGPGIPAEDRERVLEPFVRLDPSRTEPGNGLGLALVAAIARLHRARLVLADNEPGLRVNLLLPRAG